MKDEIALELISIDPNTCAPWRFHNRAIDGFEINIDSLVESIKTDGQHTPGLVRQTENDSYEIIFGYRRSLACKALGIKYKATVLPKYVDDMTCLKMMHSENEERQDVSPLQDARTFQAALDQGIFVNQEHLGQVLGLSQSRVSRILKSATLFRHDWLIGTLVASIDDISIRQALRMVSGLGSASIRDDLKKHVISQSKPPLFKDVLKQLEHLLEEASNSKTRNKILLRSGRKKVAQMSVKSDGCCTITIRPFQWSEPEFKSLMTTLSKEVITAHGGNIDWTIP